MIFERSHNLKLIIGGKSFELARERFVYFFLVIDISDKKDEIITNSKNNLKLGRVK